MSGSLCSWPEIENQGEEIQVISIRSQGIESRFARKRNMRMRKGERKTYRKAMNHSKAAATLTIVSHFAVGATSLFFVAEQTPLVTTRMRISQNLKRGATDDVLSDTKHYSSCNREGNDG